jgi:hypothetical protein
LISQGEDETYVAAIDTKFVPSSRNEALVIQILEQEDATSVKLLT